MVTHSSNITSLPRSPDDDRHSRMIKYAVMMGIRLVCIVLCLFVEGWWLLVCVLGAVVLPYVAVVVANSVNVKTSPVERPGSLLRSGAGADDDSAPEQL